MSPKPFDSRTKALPAKRSVKGYGDENALEAARALGLLGNNNFTPADLCHLYRDVANYWSAVTFNHFFIGCFVFGKNLLTSCYCFAFHNIIIMTIKI